MRARPERAAAQVGPVDEGAVGPRAGAAKFAVGLEQRADGRAIAKVLVAARVVGALFPAAEEPAVVHLEPAQGQGVAGREVDGRVPARPFHMDGVEHNVRGAQ